MIYGMYLSAQGAEAQSLRQDAIAHNLANAGTTGFKRRLALFQGHAPPEQGKGPQFKENPNRTGGVSLAGFRTDFGQGAVESTGRSLDLALVGRGFLKLQGTDSELLTRDGRLSINTQGVLVSSDSGLPVLSTSDTQIVPVPGLSDLEISSDGTVTQNAGQVVLGRLAVVDLEDPQSLVPLGENQFQSSGSEVPAGPETLVRQGYLESSGTRPVVEMLEMIESSRAFEANFNLIRYQDETVSRLLSSLGNLPRR